MISLLLIPALLAAAEAFPASGDIVVQVESLSRPDLPEGFPHDALVEGFAVLKLEISNHGSDVFGLNPEVIEVKEDGRKNRKRVRPTDITPELMKRYSSRGMGGSAEIFAGGRYPRTIDGRMPDNRTARRSPTIRASGGPGVISVETARLIREALETAELKEQLVAPGDTVEGLFYVESKKAGAGFKGTILIGEVEAEF